MSPPADGGPPPADPPEPLDLDFSALLPLFVAESQERLARMELALLELEEQPGDREALDEVFRGVHTIKGDAATLGMRELADFAHRVEDTLDRLRAGSRRMSSPMATLLLRALDALRELVAAAGGAPGRRPEDIARTLAEVIASLEEDAEPSAPSAASAPAVAFGEPASYADLASGTLRVDVERVDELLTLAGELVTARSQLLAALEQEDFRRTDLLELARDSERMYLDLQDLVMRLRMVAVGPTFRRLQRTVRDQSLALGKQAVLELEGTDVELDNSVLQRLRDPLSHLLRNALAHGIESPAERRARGKDESGRILLRTRRAGGTILIEVSDDGRGLDRDAVLERARALGLLAADREPTDHEALQLVFSPGLSTAEYVSDAAGRGVGLDVVKRGVESLRGSVEIASEPGSGTTVTIQLPLTLAVIDALHVRVGGQVFAIALDVVEEVLELPAGAFAGEHPSEVLELRDRAVTCVRLDTLLGMSLSGADQPVRRNMVVLHVGRQELGVAVDDVLGKTQTLIKPLPKILRRMPGFSGVTALHDGGLAFILDVADLLRRRFTFRDAGGAVGPGLSAPALGGGA